MREFVESLRRLYQNKKIKKIDAERQIKCGKITKEEYLYILGDTKNNSEFG